MRMTGSVMDRGTGFLLLLLSHTCSGLEVIAPATQAALFHSPALLQCSFSIEASSINPQFLAIIWYFGDKQLMRFDNKEKEVGKGLSFDEQEARRGNASLTIHNVTIADQGTYKCLVIYSPNRQHKEIKLSVHATPEVTIQKKALLKDDSNTLYCSISGFFPPEITVTWLRNNTKLLSRSGMGEFRTDADGTYRVNSSIIVTPADIQDHPSIGCQVEHVSLQSPTTDSFRVEYGVAPKVRLASSRTPDHNELIYVCEAKGFSPEPLSINWLVDGKMADLPKKSANGVFNKEIYYQVNLKEGKIPEQISCSVQHETFVSPVIDTLKVDSYNECTRNCHFGLTVGMAVLLIAALLFILVIGYLDKKKKYLKRFQVSHIHRQETLANEETVTLYCMALNCPKVTKATWDLTIEGNEPISVCDCQSYKDEETGPLLHNDYTVRTEQTERNGLRNVTAMLSFNPENSQYKKMDIKCSFTCGGKKKERSLICTFEPKKPEIKDSIEVFQDNSNGVACSAILENFYPRNIQINWSYGTDQYTEVVTTEADITPNISNHTYKAVTKCTIPRTSLKDSSRVYKVRVTWTHSSLDHPESHETTLAENTHFPKMEDIVIPTLLHGTEAKLQCVIWGYLPDNLEVKWLRRDEGNPELYELSSSNKYKIPVMESKQQPDKTFTCTASIIVLMSAITDQGSEFICRVKHPSLETTLEKMTKGLTVKGIPEIEIKYLKEMLRAKITNFSPKSIKVTWRRTEKNNKMVNYEDKDVKAVYDDANDGGTFTSVYEVSVHEKKNYKEYEVVVEHETLKSPTRKKIIRKDGKFYVIENGENGENQRCLNETIPEVEKETKTAEGKVKTGWKKKLGKKK